MHVHTGGEQIRSARQRQRSQISAVAPTPRADVLRVDIRAGTLENLTSGKRLQSKAPSAFLLEMLESGGLIPLLKSGTAGLIQKGIQ